MYGGLTKGWADDDFSVVARIYQKEAAPLPAPGPSKPAAIEEPKPGKEPPREATPDELRNIGISVPGSSPLPAPLPAPEEKKPEPAVVADSKPETAPAAEKPAPEPAKKDAEPAKADGDPAKPDADPADPSKPGQDAPLMRIRRWFGTGSAT
jgi:hypothetical protein